MEPSHRRRLRAWRHRITEAAIVRCRLAIVALLGHRLQVVPCVEQRIVAVVWLLVIDNGCCVSTTALTQWMLREIRIAEMKPAPLGVVAHLGLIICATTLGLRLRANRLMDWRAHCH